MSFSLTVQRAIIVSKVGNKLPRFVLSERRRWSPNAFAMPMRARLLLKIYLKKVLKNISKPIAK